MHHFCAWHVLAHRWYLPGRTWSKCHARSKQLGAVLQGCSCMKDICEAGACHLTSGHAQQRQNQPSVCHTCRQDSMLSASLAAMQHCLQPAFLVSNAHAPLSDGSDLHCRHLHRPCDWPQAACSEHLILIHTWGHALHPLSAPSHCCCTRLRMGDADVCHGHSSARAAGVRHRQESCI